MELKKPNRPTRLTSDIRQRSTPASVAPRPVSRTTPANQPEQPSQTAAPSESLRKSYLSRVHVSKKPALLIAVTVIICLVASLLVSTSRGEEPSTSTMKPAYQTTLPKGKNIDELGGWKRVSPAKEDPVFAYMDKIDDVTISVSQQPLPESFKSNTDTQVAELAKKFNATNKINAATITAYVGTSSKGPQSVIFTHDNLLILMKSVSRVNDTSWITYIETLK